VEVHCRLHKIPIYLILSQVYYVHLFDVFFSKKPWILSFHLANVHLSSVGLFLTKVLHVVLISCVHDTRLAHTKHFYKGLGNRPNNTNLTLKIMILFAVKFSPPPPPPPPPKFSRALHSQSLKAVQASKPCKAISKICVTF
jgi:hypothetical protein